ncbi:MULTISPECIES: tRNA uridine-5-carboxymethylaminomethyl(34) synthesis GTPase MnmE [unclassified Mesorhizobium]|uniref:tRNA uridine-5-carboxymethylaminomethyl(34) synthesis GTPase MnmE n=1 Tax=unclassified Mesorhizobium TaxID=325217 RepID=UPI000FD60FD6|nr:MULTISPECIES: tRNA uridine-5-carboxymethylaminomethyl(34) synthesis GTPase MnmE [unclassified Mesorhizobium]RVB74399.1 tRNA uridine-5-carboxymethylaminomethyl(34) synthesis GTPase MnmE [Mesorhizobium sp. M6A.T.Cr.TU.014.01.1.1]RWP75027.1 MAG: tRNA uridine-5-carboxymethylaminomethyl(34) synthesis GTPase MnmE [Mesorhizobium sp.]RWP99140.1 MAG: tRNA uridine-5-carboxymethylaminomethyl(34) synthesis GTPase MnmE [Mesorhizobium sp.]RWQ04891.1 MAG: tRNA uridine-5-carboxymethylaminomethyl(34) synthes
MISVGSIVALSSGRLPAGVAVIRISGPQSRFVVETIAGPMVKNRVAAYRKFRAPDGSVLDSGLVVFFAGPNSFTGEDIAEFHVHGGRAVVAKMLETIAGFDGVRHAEPGEFTRRAFLNGKVDLVETEALADLVNAETEAQRRFAVQNAEGVQSELYLGWRRRLIHARAMIEAEIDFADEDDVPGSVAETVWSDVRAMIDEIERHVEGFRAAEIIRDGFEVVILGAPNAGKSSLFNALARREAAIVTEEPGTTRDLLEVVLDLEGMRVRVTDTAGLRETPGRIEAIGIERARSKAGTADLLLVLEDMVDPVPIGAIPADIPTLRIGTKVDLLRDESLATRYDAVISTRDGTGLAELLAEIGQRAAAQIGQAGDVLPSRLRHVELLNEAKRFLLAAVAGDERGQELRAEELRLAADRLGRIVGAVDVEDLLDVIFSQFCIGK